MVLVVKERKGVVFFYFLSFPVDRRERADRGGQNISTPAALLSCPLIGLCMRAA